MDVSNSLGETISFKDSCDPGNHTQATPICVVCGVNRDDEQKELKMQAALSDIDTKTDMAKMVEFLKWALAMIDENYKETGKIGFAEVIVYKAAKAHMLKMKETLK